MGEQNCTHVFNFGYAIQDVWKNKLIHSLESASPNMSYICLGV